jgi:chloramphenicol 3-O phosphotransferase
MSRIILLNGCGSAGKTSIAKSIAYLSDDFWLTFGVDTFIGMMPHGKQESYFKFIPAENENGPLMRVESQENGKNLFDVMPKFAKMIADQGNNLIIDEVLLDQNSLKAYAENLKNHTVYYIGVFCDLKTMQERELLRGDRCIGLSNDQIDRVHQGTLNSYDFTVDTTSISPFEAARLILEFVQGNSVGVPF